MTTTYHLLMAAAALHGEDADPFRPRLGAYDHTYTRDMSDEMRLGRLGKVGTIPGAYTSPTWRPGDTTRCVCPVCDPDDEPGGDDPDSFWREQTLEERAAISAAYVKAYGDRPYGDQSHAFTEEG